MRLRDRVLAGLRRRLGENGLPLTLVFWDGSDYELGAAPRVTIALTRRALLPTLLRGDIDSLAAAYVRGDLTVEGRLQDILAVGIALAERIGRFAWLRLLDAVFARRRFRHSRTADAGAIRHHYDVSNEFYALWLDRHMIYSCAYFHTGTEDIDTAQEQKLDHICRKLRLKPGERLLDIGCGWGGLLIWAAQRYGVSGVGVTLSEKQHGFASRRVAEIGLAQRIEIRLQDYRDIAGEECFDKIVSVGMYEHVGRANLPLYFGTIQRLLKTGGVALNHGITTGNPDDGPHGPPGAGFMDRYVFPGGELPHIARVITEMARQGLEILDVETLRPHYGETLLRWVQRLEAARETAIALAGIERYRMWRIYMAGCAFAFERGWMSLHQVVVTKPDAAGLARRPWTRRYQYEPDDAAVLSGPLRWGGL